MTIQKPIDYLKIFIDLCKRRGLLTGQRDEIDVELARITPLIIAMFPLIPEDQQKQYQESIADLEAESGGLQDAVKLVFSEHKGEWLSVSKVRDYLIEMGLDFKRYQANPLASIGTTLKRMVPKYLESTTSGSGTLYSRRLTLADRIAEAETVLAAHAARLEDESKKK
jgi:uncharacterized protein (UPF0335 family)